MVERKLSIVASQNQVKKQLVNIPASAIIGLPTRKGEVDVGPIRIDSEVRDDENGSQGVQNRFDVARLF